MWVLFFPWVGFVPLGFPTKVFSETSCFTSHLLGDDLGRVPSLLDRLISILCFYFRLWFSISLLDVFLFLNMVFVAFPRGACSFNAFEFRKALGFCPSLFYISVSSSSNKIIHSFVKNLLSLDHLVGESYPAKSFDAYGV